MNSGIRIKKIELSTDPLQLECDSTLESVEIAYETYGELNSNGTNVILICHALTGDAHAAGAFDKNEQLIKKAPAYNGLKHGQAGWWEGTIGPDMAFDTRQHFIICSNILGSCYGTTGPRTLNPESNKPFHNNFPQVTVRDMVRVQYLLLKSLGVTQLKSIAGGSLGGMQALEWALMYPDMVQSIIPIATSIRHSPWAIAFNHIGRSAIMNDPQWKSGNFDSPDLTGLGIARQIGMVSYRSDVSFLEKFDRDFQDNDKEMFDHKSLFKVENYLNYQGQKLINRFDPNSYIILSRALDLHDVTRGRGPVDEVLARVKAKALCIGINSDILYPSWEQKQIAGLLPCATYKEIDSNAGHDAFLIEFDQLESFIKPFLGALD